MSEIELLESASFPKELMEKVASLPQKSGCYLYKNDTGKIIYVGKAIKLRNRVKQYFQDRPKDAKTKVLVSKISDLDFFITDTEAEALILEDTLIKEHKPKYNILLRDDKTFPYIRVTNEDYPRIFSTRIIVKDGSKYFGPFTDVRAQKYVLKTLSTLYKIRSCNLDITADSIAKQKHKVCLDFHIKKCEGPCVGLVEKQKYAENIKQSVAIINGKTGELEKQIETQMLEAAENLKFEEAALLRNRLSILMDYNSKQKIVSTENIDRDVFGIFRNEDYACTLVFKVREGKLLGKRHYLIHNVLEQVDAEIIQRTMESWYLESDFVPREIFLPCEPADIEYITGWLGEKRSGAVSVMIPKIGDKRKLVEMANTNASQILGDHIEAIEKREQVISRAVISLQRDLRLKNPPRLIECFDNSHIQGTDLVSSMVCFEDGKPKKSAYLKFKNKTVLKNDDFASMREVILRRYTKLKFEIEEYEKAENKELFKKIPRYPDMVIIDGGKGQLSSAMEIFTELGLQKKIIVIGLAKRLEEVFFPNESESVLLPRASSSLRLIQHLRDEAHRFAITYHRSLRDKRTLQTELTEIQGLGDKTAEKLLIGIGSVTRIKEATKEELKEYVNEKIADKIIAHFAGISETNEENE